MGMLAMLAMLLLFPISIGVCVVVVKANSQHEHDKQHKTFRLYFPRELDDQRALEWFRSFSGTLRPHGRKLEGSPTVVLETYADHKGIIHRLKVPWGSEDIIVPQLRLAGIRADEEHGVQLPQFDHIVELCLRRYWRPLFIDSIPAVSARLLKTFEGLRPGEALLMQTVLTPAISARPPIQGSARSVEFQPHQLLTGDQADKDEVSDRRKKLEEPNFLAVIRLAAIAETDAKARHLVQRPRAMLASTRNKSTYFAPRRFVWELQERIERAAGSVFFPVKLSVPEVAALSAWRLGSYQVVGMPRPLGRQFAPHGAVPSEGIRIGRSAFPDPNGQRPIAIGYAESSMHTAIVGETGTGKSVLLGNVAKQVMAAGHGLIVMEASGNLYQAVLDYVPKNRLDDVHLLDLSDKQHPVSFNVLDQGAPETVIDEIMDLFAHRYGMGVWSDEYILHGMRTLAEDPSLTLMDLAVLLSPTADEVAWVDTVTRKVKDPELKRWWQRHEHRGKFEQQKRADPVLSRISQMGSRPELRYMLGQSKSAFQVLDVLNDNKILFINLKGVSKDTAGLAGTLMMNAIWESAQRSKKSVPTHLIVDEAGRFMDMHIGMQTMLAEARKHKLHMWLAFQYLAQLKPEVREGLANARNKIVLASNDPDARLLAKELHGEVDAEDITDLQAFEAIASVLTPQGTSGPVSINTYAPARPTGSAHKVRELSRNKYSRPLKDVQAEMEVRYHPGKEPRRKSKQSGENWGL